MNRNLFYCNTGDIYSDGFYVILRYIDGCNETTPLLFLYTDIVLAVGLLVILAMCLVLIRLVNHWLVYRLGYVFTRVSSYRDNIFLQRPENPSATPSWNVPEYTNTNQPQDTQPPVQNNIPGLVPIGYESPDDIPALRSNDESSDSSSEESD